jgi:hypothetical protein
MEIDDILACYDLTKDDVVSVIPFKKFHSGDINTTKLTEFYRALWFPEDSGNYYIVRKTDKML